MTVLELIEQLKEYPPDMTVYLADWNEQYCDPFPLDKIKIDKWTEWSDEKRERTLVTGLVLGDDDR